MSYGTIAPRTSGKNHVLDREKTEEKQVGHREIESKIHERGQRRLSDLERQRALRGAMEVYRGGRVRSMEK